MILGILLPFGNKTCTTASGLGEITKTAALVSHVSVVNVTFEFFPAVRADRPKRLGLHILAIPLLYRVHQWVLAPLVRGT